MAAIANYTDLVRQEALRLGFEDCGFSKAELLADDKTRLQQWLEAGMHGKMSYMANHFDKRVDPTKLIEGAKSVISVILNYFPGQQQEDKQAPIVSKYAYGEDYHHVLKRRLWALLKYINDNIGPTEGRAFVDSAPVLDKAWAAKAGIGWIGKNSNLISPKHGSFVFIGSLIVDREFEYNKTPLKDFCGGCTKCIKACPTNAIVADRVVDGSKCISYFTIEYKDDELPQAYKGKFKDRVFGCDICQDVCPWNRKVIATNVKEFEPQGLLLSLHREQWKELDEEQYRAMFKKSAVKRAGFKGLKRNIEFVFSPKD